MDKQEKSLDMVGLFKFGVTTLFFIDFIRRTFESAVSLNSIGMIVSVSFVSLFALVGLKNEFYSVQLHNKPWAKQFSKSKKIKVVLTYTFASFVTYMIAVLLNINITFAASLVVLSMLSFKPESFTSFQGTVYTGTFTGMVSDQFISSWPLALLFALAGSLVYLYFQPSYRALGGRAGLNAYMTSFAFILLFADVKPMEGAPLPQEMIFISFLFLIGGAFTAYLLKESTRLAGAQAAMLVTLTLNILIPNKWSALITAGFMGSFMGTSDSKRIKSLPFLFLVELFAFLLFIPAYPLLGGLGGKLGMVTLIGYMAADGIRSLANYGKN